MNFRGCSFFFFASFLLFSLSERQQAGFPVKDEQSVCRAITSNGPHGPTSVRNDYFDWRTVQAGRGEKIKELGRGLNII